MAKPKKEMKKMEKEIKKTSERMAREVMAAERKAEKEVRKASTKMAKDMDVKLHELEEYIQEEALVEEPAEEIPAEEVIEEAAVEEIAREPSAGCSLRADFVLFPMKTVISQDNDAPGGLLFNIHDRFLFVFFEGVIDIRMDFDVYVVGLRGLERLPF